MSRPDWKTYFLSIAEVVATRADCTRRQVGAVIVKDHRIVATGYNGGRAGGPSCQAGQCPRGTKTIEEVPSFEQGNSDYSDCIAIHAEVNALLYASRSDVEGATLYITCAPCGECEKIIGNSGISVVIWPGGYMNFVLDPKTPLVLEMRA